MSFEHRICEHIPHLRRYAMGLCGEAHGAEDLVQDCLEQALRKRHLWRPGRGRLRSWLFRILHRTWLNQLSSARCRREVVTDDPSGPVGIAARQEGEVQVRDVLAKVSELPAEQRAALVLMVVEGPSYREAARILDINVGTLRSRLARARANLRERCEVRPTATVSHLRRVK